MMKNDRCKNLIPIKIVYYIKEEEPLLALKWLDLVYYYNILGLTLSPGDYYFERGLIFFELQKFKEAEFCFRRALRSKLKKSSFVYLETIHKLLQILIKNKSGGKAFKLLMWTTEIQLSSMNHLTFIPYFSNPSILKYWNRLALSKRKKVLNNVKRWTSKTNKFFGSGIVIENFGDIETIALKTKELLATVSKTDELITTLLTLIDDSKDSLQHVYLGIYREVESALSSISIPFYRKILENMLHQKIIPKLHNHRSVRKDVSTQL